MSNKETKSPQPENLHGLKDVLTKLMEESDIDDASLSRETGVPASSISRMRLNPDANPTASTLRPLAKFFGISISQLLGDEPLPKERLPGTHHPLGFTLARIPIIHWEWVNLWLKEDKQTLPFKEKLTRWISTEKAVSPKAFALVIPTESFGLILRKGSLIIIDPETQVSDGDLALVSLLQEDTILLRKILIDGNDTYIKSVNPEMKSTKLLEKGAHIFGVVIEIRFSLQHAEESLAKSIEEYETVSIFDPVKSLA